MSEVGCAECRRMVWDGMGWERWECSMGVLSVKWRLAIGDWQSSN